MLTHRKTQPSRQTLRNHYPYSVSSVRGDPDIFRRAHLGLRFYWRPPTPQSPPRWMFVEKAGLDLFMEWVKNQPIEGDER